LFVSVPGFVVTWELAVRTCSLQGSNSLSPEKHMSRGSTSSEFCCPRCGAEAALSFPNPDPQLQEVTLKCLTCATLMRLPKDKVFGAGSSGPRGAIGPSEVSSTL
jgi:hypothetical protein